jgi:drug/metabolite transporter (DMT)-like permease
VSGFATGAAVASAIAFAGSTSLQHRAVQQTAARTSGSTSLIGQLLARPVWLTGQVLAVVGLLLHATALNAGSVLVVQPIVISGVVLAVPVRSALERRWPWPRELIAVCVTAVGLTVFLIASSPTGGRTTPRTGPAALICLGCALVAGVAVLVARTVRNPVQAAFLLGMASGVLFGAVAGLIKAVVYLGLHHSVTGLLTSWTTWTLIVLGGTGVVINQLAYRLARLSASMPVLNVLNGVVSVVFGVVGYSEVLRHSATQLGFEVLAFALVTVGLFIVAHLADGEPAARPEQQPVGRNAG